MIVFPCRALATFGPRETTLIDPKEMRTRILGPVEIDWVAASLRPRRPRSSPTWQPETIAFRATASESTSGPPRGCSGGEPVRAPCSWPCPLAVGYEAEITAQINAS